MTTDCQNCPLRRRDLFTPMSEADVASMQEFKVGELKVEAGTPIVMEGSQSPQLFTVLHGMGLRYKHLENGDRQVLNFIMPGDFIGLQSALMGEMGHSVEATTRMVLCVFKRSALWSFFQNNPSRAFSITWLSAVEEHFLGETLTTVGQRDALQSVAWSLCKIFDRAEAVGLTSNRSMRLPFKQRDLADALGLSLVHTNKTLAKLKSRQLASWTDDLLTIPDMQELADVALLDTTKLPKRPIL